ncbi:MAG: 2-dehydro-3-deoxy-6-phosphogalactonate aldolase [Sphingobium sp.]|uniref:2-dehydro-3-deoxy-6-phosphogalactonate aldolase n=1 Tax=Sphingobium sp. TaxID=1912891 RepID=UPI0029A0E69A|nr:2-dehydro-3-deoxy-6-phosphogalactonate aldolase [Sphingobium sp.]MDX3909423.1 2-dehydro-3-deoxy-6-phosphogalactonate aldolase [Sphingobium sp.]
MMIDDILALGAPPIMAILRGVRPDEVSRICRALIDSGIRLIEVPFNSPKPAQSIAKVTREFAGDAVIGGGTVLTRNMVDQLANAGGEFMVSPNTNPDVIGYAVASGLEPVPGFLTPTEAFAAVEAGARRLKIFPGSAFGPAYLSTLRDVLPHGIGLWAVGGVGAENLSEWRGRQVDGIGVGGALYKAGDTAESVGAKGAQLVSAWNAT